MIDLTHIENYVNKPLGTREVFHGGVISSLIDHVSAKVYEINTVAGPVINIQYTNVSLNLFDSQGLLINPHTNIDGSFTYTVVKGLYFLLVDSSNDTTFTLTITTNLDFSKTSLWVSPTNPVINPTILPLELSKSKRSIRSIFGLFDRLQLLDSKPSYIPKNEALQIIANSLVGSTIEATSIRPMNFILNNNEIKIIHPITNIQYNLLVEVKDLNTVIIDFDDYLIDFTNIPMTDIIARIQFLTLFNPVLDL